MDGGYKRAVLIWHRRSGKDKTLVNFVAKKAMERVGSYYYFFPTYTQGNKILWTGMDKEGFKFTDHIPQSIRKRTDNGKMLIELLNGSIIQVVGTDNIDSVVGTNPIGCVFSEYALQDPRAWDFVRPILAENGGWAVFNYTPRGRNHGYDIYQIATQDPKKWFSQVLKAPETKAISEDVLREEREEIVKKDGNDALYQQEYLCSFDAPIQGAYYATQLIKAYEENRITTVPYESSLPVDTYWDLGVGDATPIWFIQTAGQEIRLIDYYETSGEGLAHYALELQKRGYVYRTNGNGQILATAPHDIEVRELGTGKSRRETAMALGIDFQIAPKLSIEDGIDAARNILGRCWFDKDKCGRGLDALKSYHKEYDEKNKVYKNRPHHDWSSHAADAFRYFAVSHRSPTAAAPKQDFSNWSLQ